MGKYHILPNSEPPKKVYEESAEETQFFDALLIVSSHLKGEYQLSRLSNGTINVSYKGYPIGKIKLQGRTRSMMVMENLYDSKIIEGEFSDFIKGIDYWLYYIKRFLREK